MAGSAAREGRGFRVSGKDFLQQTDGREETCKGLTPAQRLRPACLETVMSYEALNKEIASYEKAHAEVGGGAQRAEKRIPLGVASISPLRALPIFVRDGNGSQDPRHRWQRIY